MKKKDIEQIVDDCLLNDSSPTHTTAQLTLEDIKNLHKTLSEGSLQNLPKFEGKKYLDSLKEEGIYIPDTESLDTDKLFSLRSQKSFGKF